jgi:hypothetical protein
MNCVFEGEAEDTHPEAQLILQRRQPVDEGNLAFPQKKDNKLVDAAGGGITRRRSLSPPLQLPPCATPDPDSPMEERGYREVMLVVVTADW